MFRPTKELTFKNAVMKNKDTIPSIYNYCDRWCERCPFTSRCANFALGEEYFPNQEDRDTNNEHFWGKLQEVFTHTMEMLVKELEKHGIDINTLELDDAEQSMARLDKAACANECVQAAQKYYKIAGKWIESSNTLFEQKKENLLLQARLELPNNDPAEDAASIVDAMEIIQWYQYQIYVKLMRAISSQIEEAEEPDNYPKDSDGSAKVALIGLDRSIAAWATLRDHFPEKEDEILDILIELSRLRSSTENTFPNARTFMRPGLDNII